MKRQRCHTKLLVIALFAVVQFRFHHQWTYVPIAAVLLDEEQQQQQWSSSSSMIKSPREEMSMMINASATTKATTEAPNKVRAGENSNDELSPIVSVFRIPEKPDQSIGELLRDIIPDANNSFPLSSCSPTSQYKIIVTTTTVNRTQGNQQNEMNNLTSFEIWRVESYDEYGQRKTYGGDEFQISFSHNGMSTGRRFIASAVAIPRDHNDGTYSLEFMTPSLFAGNCVLNNGCSSHGTLKLDMVYTCSIGRMTRPSKDHWKHGGYLRGKTYFLYNITAPAFIAKFEGPPKISQEQELVDLDKFDKVICFGDSLLGNMRGFWWKKYIFKKNNMEVQANVGSSIRGDLLLNETFPLLEKMHGKDLRNTTTATSNNNVSIAIILGSAAWEMSANLGPYPGHFFNHSLAMYQDLVMGVRERYPNVSIFWKSPQAVHLTALDDFCYSDENIACVNRVRYISNSIARYLHEEQKRIMNKLKVPILDVFDATYLAESWHMGGDCQHYRHWLNIRLLDYFLSASVKLVSMKRRLQYIMESSSTSSSSSSSSEIYGSSDEQSSSPWWTINFL